MENGSFGDISLIFPRTHFPLSHDYARKSTWPIHAIEEVLNGAVEGILPHIVFLLVFINLLLVAALVNKSMTSAKKTAIK